MLFGLGLIGIRTGLRHSSYRAGAGAVPGGSGLWSGGIAGTDTGAGAVPGGFGPLRSAGTARARVRPGRTYNKLYTQQVVARNLVYPATLRQRGGFFAGITILSPSCAPSCNHGALSSLCGPSFDKAHSSRPDLLVHLFTTFMTAGYFLMA